MLNKLSPLYRLTTLNRTHGFATSINTYQAFYKRTDLLRCTDTVFTAFIGSIDSAHVEAFRDALGLDSMDAFERLAA